MAMAEEEVYSRCSMSGVLSLMGGGVLLYFEERGAKSHGRREV